MIRTYCIGLTVLVLFQAFTQHENNDGYTINGKITGVDTGWFYLSVASTSQIIDSARITDGKFSFTGKVDEPVKCLLISSATDYVDAIFLENTVYDVSIVKEPYSCKVTGGRLQSAYQQYITSMAPYYDSLHKTSVAINKLSSDQSDKKAQLESERTRITAAMGKKAGSFIEANPDLYLTPGIILSSFGKKQYLPQLKHYFSLLTPRIKSSHEGRDLEKNIAELESALAVGDVVKPFKLKDAANKEFTLVKPGKGKYILIDFWASWCGPCIKEFPQLKNAYTQYNSQGFDIISISLDKDREQWMKALKQAALPWKQLVDQSTAGVSVAQTYGVRAVPACYLIDSNMKIVAMNLSGASLSKKLAELFNQK